MKLLVVEDEPAVAALLSRSLGGRGHAVEVASEGHAALTRALERSFDAVVLDRSLPDGDGLQVLVEWRRRRMTAPVLVLTARADLEERLQGLRAGADDYLGKPFDLDELALRLEGLHRRATRDADVELGAGVRLDRDRRALTGGPAEVSLTAREFGLLVELAAHPGLARTRNELLSTVWGEDLERLPNVVDVYVGYLRQKLARAGATALVETVRGQGYRLARPE